MSPTKPLHPALLDAMRASRPEWAGDGSALGIAASGRVEALVTGLAALGGPRITEAGAGGDVRAASHGFQRPLLIRGGCSEWPAAREWTVASLADRLGDAPLICGLTPGGDELRVPFAAFAAFMGRQRQDAPLYGFHDAWDGELKSLLEDLAAPIWASDLMAHAPSALRPPHRWLLVGPARSGSLPHVDPLGTCAWNAALRGVKVWVVWSPEAEDRVAQAVAGGPWASVPTVCFERLLAAVQAGGCPPPHVFEQRPGDVVVLPSAWVHAVLNPGDTLAVTENFVPPERFEIAWSLVRESRPGLAYAWSQGLGRAGVEAPDPPRAAELSRLQIAARGIPQA